MDLLIDSFPQLTHLHMGCCNEQNIKFILSKNKKPLIELSFDHPIDETHISLFNNNIFPGISHLQFTDDYNEKLDNIIHMFSNLLSLELGSDFDQDISILAENLPKLEYLKLRHNFNKNVDALANSFPELRCLLFSGKFYQNIDSLSNSFPKLECLMLGLCCDINIHIIRNFYNLKYLEIDNIGDIKLRDLNIYL